MMEKIRLGFKPTDVFKEILIEDPLLSTHDIASLFLEEFLEVDSVAGQAIWYWRKPGRDQGVDDERINTILLHHLKDAGYL